MTLKFYHTQGATPAEVDGVLPKLLGRVLSAGHRVLLVCPSPARLARLDEQLWTFDASSFVPHSPLAARLPGIQPVGLVLPSEASAHLGAQSAAQPSGPLPVVLGGAEDVWPVLWAAGVSQGCHVFGTTEAEVAKARNLWQSAKGWPREYWQSTAKGWVCQRRAAPQSTSQAVV